MARTRLGNGELLGTTTTSIWSLQRVLVDTETFYYLLAFEPATVASLMGGTAKPQSRLVKIVRTESPHRSGYFRPMTKQRKENRALAKGFREKTKKSARKWPKGNQTPLIPGERNAQLPHISFPGSAPVVEIRRQTLSASGARRFFTRISPRIETTRSRFFTPNGATDNRHSWKSSDWSLTKAISDQQFQRWLEVNLNPPVTEQLLKMRLTYRKQVNSLLFYKGNFG